jgi:hypothetical protein
MEGLVMGGLAATSLVATLLFWVLLVSPDWILNRLGRGQREDSDTGFGWTEPDPNTLWLLVCVSGCASSCLTWMCGAVMTILWVT